MADASGSTRQADRTTIQRRIDSLDVSADLKALLSSLVGKTMEIAGQIIDVGGRILTFTFDLAKAYPGTAFGVLAALVLSYLVGSIPMLGAVLSPVLAPMLLIIGIGLGALNDMTDGPMRRELSTLGKQFQAAGIA